MKTLLYNVNFVCDWSMYVHISNAIHIKETSSEAGDLTRSVWARKVHMLVPPNNNAHYMGVQGIITSHNKEKLPAFLEGLQSDKACFEHGDIYALDIYSLPREDYL